jgi:hypothetical protein
LTTDVRTRRLTRSTRVAVFAVCRELVGGEAPASQQCSTPAIRLVTGCTSMHFGENQLSPCSFGISPLPTAHPRLLQQSPVRPFTACYGRCSLAMGSSHGFRSTPGHSRACHTRVRWASGCHCLRQATGRHSSGHTPKGTRSRLPPRRPSALTAWTRSVSGSVSLPSPGCFSPFPHGTVRYRSRPVGCLGGWSPQIPTGFPVSRGTRDACHAAGWKPYRTVTVSGASSQTLLALTRPTLRRMHPPRHVSQPPARNACTLGTYWV